MGTMGIVGLLAAGGVTQAYAQNAAGSYEQKIADRNADIADLQAVDAKKRGEQAVMLSRRETHRTVGSQRAGFAGQGVEVDAGSAGDVVDATETIGALDEMTLRNNAALEAWGFKVQASDLRARGKMAKVAGRNQAIGTLLTTGAQAAMFYDDAMYRRNAGPYSRVGDRASGLT